MPIPPEPISPSISQGPSFVPGGNTSSERGGAKAGSGMARFAFAVSENLRASVPQRQQ
ncbi:MAG: hypothetical protein R3F10_01350 [Lysobacteraceae bacterium]